MLQISLVITALMMVSIRGNIKAVSFLIANGANVCVKNRLGKTAQDMARDHDRTEVVKLFQLFDKM